MNYELKIDQLLQTGIQQFQMLSSKMSQSKIGQLAGRATIQIRKNILNDYLQNNLGLAPRIILLTNLSAAIFSGIITRHLELKAKKTDQSPEAKANKGIKIFTATALVLNTGLYLVTNFPADSSWIIVFTLAQTIAATAYFKNRELKEHRQDNGQLLKLQQDNKQLLEDKSKLQSDIDGKNGAIAAIHMRRQNEQNVLVEKDKELATLQEKLDFMITQDAGARESKSKLEESHKIAIENLHNQITEQTFKIDALKKQIEELSTLSSNQKTGIANLNNQIIAKTSEIDRLQQEIEKLSTKTSKQSAFKSNKSKKNPTTKSSRLTQNSSPKNESAITPINNPLTQVAPPSPDIDKLAERLTSIHLTIK